MDSLEMIPDSEDPSVILETPTTIFSSLMEDQNTGGEMESSNYPEVVLHEDLTTVVDETVDNSHSVDLFESLELQREDASLENQEMTESENQEESIRIENGSESLEPDQHTEENVDDEESIANDKEELDETEEPMQEEQDDTDNEDEENENFATTQLQVGRIQKIMKICMKTVDDEDIPEDVPEVRQKGKRRNKGKAVKKVISNTANMIITKEAIFLTTIATELFIAAVTQQSSRITVATKKKTMAVDHVKRALSDSECFEFLQGCFQPSLLIGD